MVPHPKTDLPLQSVWSLEVRLVDLALFVHDVVAAVVAAVVVALVVCPAVALVVCPAGAGFRAVVLVVLSAAAAAADIVEVNVA